MSNSNYLWEKLIKDLKKTLSSEALENWFQTSYFESIDLKKHTATIISENSFISEFLSAVYDKEIKDVLKKHTSLNFDIYYDYYDNNNKIEDTKKFQTKTNDSQNAEHLLFLDRDKPSGTQHIFKKQEFSFDEYKKPEQIITNTVNKKNPSLNKNYTFDNFVVGEGNKYAHAVALSIASTPGNIYNPLFIYGGVGLGKTHLLHAIGNEIEKEFPDAKIECVSSEKFLNDYVSSIKPHNHSKNNNHDVIFRNKYRNVDALLIDDIQFLSGKTETLKSFFHTFNDLQENGKQIVLVSDRSPDQLNDLEDRLVSRFKSGLPVDITPPDFETRVAILKVKCNELDLSLDDSTLSFISSNISSNIRELEGTLKKIKAISDIKKEQPSLKIAEEVISTFVTKSKKNIDSNDIIKICSEYYRISVNDILSSKRKKEIVQARDIAIYLCREMTSLSLPALGERFNKDHTSILYANNKIVSQIEELAEEIEIIKEKILNL